MPIGELYINNIDAYIEYGMSMTSGALSALMTPAPNKELIENKSRQEHGKRVITENVKVDERELNLPFHITAKTKDDFLDKYSKLCSLLAIGKLEIKTKYELNKVYRTNYISCSQFSEYRFGIAKFTLKLNEPNPMNRNV